MSTLPPSTAEPGSPLEAPASAGFNQADDSVEVRRSAPLALAGRAIRSHAGMVVTVVLLIWATWPIPTLAPQTGLDQSWQAALHLAIHRSVPFGSNALFTYGPLGFLGVPRLYYQWTGMLAMLFTIAVQAGYVTTLLVLLRRLIGFVPAIAATFVIVLATWLEPAEVAAILVSLWCLMVAARRDVSPRMRIALIGLAGGLSAILVLLKFNTGVITALSVVVAAAALRGWRSSAVVGIGIAALTGTLWFISGGTINGATKFLTGSLAIAAGYTDAMAFEEHGRGWEYVAAAVLCVLLATSVIAALRWRAVAHPVVTSAVVAWVMFGELKRGFVRHDGHSIAFFVTAAVVLLAFEWPQRAWRALPLLTGFVAVLALPHVIALPTAHIFDAPGRMRQARSQILTMSSASRRRHFIADARRSMQATLGFSDVVTAAIHGHTVHIDPSETSAVWAYQLGWSPEPIFQAYNAWTAELDRRNAAALSGAQRPERIVRHGPLEAIDGRDPLMEQPRTTLVLICSYREIAASPTWEVLAAGPSRCGSMQPIAPPVTVASGAAIDIPAAPAGTFVVAEFDLHSRFLRRFSELVFKPRRTDQISLDGRPYRLVASTATGPTLLCPPAGLGYSQQFTGRGCAHTLTLQHAGTATVRFFDVSFTDVTAPTGS